MEKLYKITGPNGEAVHGGSGKWSLPEGDKPGRWMPLKEIVPCESGYHLLRVQDISLWLKNGVLWEAEGDPGGMVTQEDKVVVGRARLLSGVGDLTDNVLRASAILSAQRVLPIFENVRPGDDRPRKAIEAALVCLVDPFAVVYAAYVAAYVAAKAAAKAANTAAYAAANAAAANTAAAYAAYAAANAAAAYAANTAAKAAAYAAANAANAAAANITAYANAGAVYAAVKAERVKQGEDIFRLLIKN